MSYINIMKEKLISQINEMKGSLASFVRKPGKDFTRNRELGFEKTMQIILSMGGKALNEELLDYFDFSADTVTASAFVQQRDKILPAAFEHLFRKFTSFVGTRKTFDSYKLLATDGSSLNIARNPGDTETFYTYKKGSRGYNQLYLNVLYDLCNNIYEDALIQPGRKTCERSALIDMLKRSKLDDKTILVADRGYESFNVLANLQEKGWKYVVRVRDINSNCILSTLKLPSSGEFDVQTSLILTRKNTNMIKSRPDLYKHIPRKQRFDFFTPQNDSYAITFRVVRVMLENGSYEALITNLCPILFPMSKIKAIYGLRWGVETSFRKLKYTIGLTCFHARKKDCIKQEIFARLTFYNFCESIVKNTVINKNNLKYTYQVNFTAVVSILRHFFRPPRSSSITLDVNTLISKYLLPIRPGRSIPRKIVPKSVVSFNYRTA